MRVSADIGTPGSEGGSEGGDPGGGIAEISGIEGLLGGDRDLGAGAEEGPEVGQERFAAGPGVVRRGAGDPQGSLGFVYLPALLWLVPAFKILRRERRKRSGSPSHRVAAARRLWNNPLQRKDLALSSRGRKPCTNAVQ